MRTMDDHATTTPAAVLKHLWPKASVSLPFTFERGVRLEGAQVLAGVTMGYRSYANPGSMVREGVKIGRYCSIGRNVTIAPGDHPMDGLTTHPLCLEGQRYPRRPADTTRADRHANTVIGHDVWISDSVIVTAGVHVGTGAVIGAGAVVTKDVAPYTVVGGVPARKIRERFLPQVAEALLASEWWTINETGLKTLDFNDVMGCLERFDGLRREFGTHAPEFTTIG